MDVRLQIEADAEAAARVVAERLAEAARTGGHVVLTGGATPKRAYELASELEPDWSKAEVWWGDERCVSPDDDRSNFGMVKGALLDRLERGPAAVHRIKGEVDAQQAATEYEQELRGITFDLVLNGLGPDGHTASLFPDAPTLEIRDRIVVAAEAKHEPFVERITLTIPALANCREMIYLAVGKEKAAAARCAFAEAPSPSTPASLARSTHGETVAVLDRDAAAQLHP